MTGYVIVDQVIHFLFHPSSIHIIIIHIYWEEFSYPRYRLLIRYRGYYESRVTKKRLSLSLYFIMF